MVVCNFYRENKPIGEIEEGYRYVCKECFKKMKITIDDEEINKEFLY